jgi:hypothetical protein
MRDKIAEIAPGLVSRHGAAATAYQLRYLCRRAVSMRDGNVAWNLAKRAMRASLRPFVEEPMKTIVTLTAAGVLNLLGATFYARTEQWLLRNG